MSDFTALIVYLFALLLFCLTFYFSGILKNCRDLLSIIWQAFGTIADNSLDDQKKEKLVQAASLGMLTKTLILFLKVIIILGFTLAPFLAADSLNIVSFEDSSQFALRFDVLLITTLPIMIFLVIKVSFFSKT